MISKSLYNYIGRCLAFASTPLRKPYLARTKRARVAILDRENRILLVKNWLSDQHWTTPGGGIGRSEEPIRAAIREIEEELGVVMELADLEPITVVKDEAKTGESFELHLFMAKLENPLIKLHKYEITEYNWVELAEINSNFQKDVNYVATSVKKQINRGAE